MNIETLRQVLGNEEAAKAALPIAKEICEHARQDVGAAKWFRMDAAPRDGSWFTGKWITLHEGKPCMGVLASVRYNSEAQNWETHDGPVSRPPDEWQPYPAL